MHIQFEDEGAAAGLVDVNKAGVLTLFSGSFNNKVRSLVIECSFAVDAEIHQITAFGSLFNTHRRFTNNPRQ